MLGTEVEVKFWTRLTFGPPGSELKECFDLRLTRSASLGYMRDLIRDHRRRGWCVHRSSRRAAARKPRQLLCSSCGLCHLSSGFAVRQRSRADCDRICKCCSAKAEVTAGEGRAAAVAVKKAAFVYPTPRPVPLAAAEESSVPLLLGPVIAPPVPGCRRKKTARKSKDGEPVESYSSSLAAAPVALPDRYVCVETRWGLSVQSPAAPPVHVPFLWTCGRNELCARSAPDDKSHSLGHVPPGVRFQDVTRVGVAGTARHDRNWVYCWACLRDSGLGVIWVLVAFDNGRGFWQCGQRGPLFVADREYTLQDFPISDGG